MQAIYSLIYHSSRLVRQRCSEFDFRSDPSPPAYFYVGWPLIARLRPLLVPLSRGKGNIARYHQ